MLPRPVGIIGAGLSGLTLGRCLASKGIAATIFEKEPRPKIHLQNRSGLYEKAEYAITLHEWAYRPLITLLGLDEAAFRGEVEVFSPIQSARYLSKNTSHILNIESERDTIRCNRGKLVKLLRPRVETEKLSIQWGHAAQRAEALPDGIELSFGSRRPFKTDLLIGADGIHSQMQFSVLPERKRYRVLPFIVYTGRRFLSTHLFRQTYAQYMKRSPVIACYHGDIRLEISAHEVHPSEGLIMLRWTYSRHMNADSHVTIADILYNKHNRQCEMALRKELDALEGLKEPFSHIFGSDRASKDQIVSWIMRDTLASDVDLQKSPDRRMALIGDAAHVIPMLGRREHSIAIQDGLDLAEHIAQNPSTDLNTFVSRKYPIWKQASIDRERKLFGLHPSASRIRKVKIGPLELQPADLD